VIGDGTDIGPHTQLDDCVVGRDCVIRQTVGADAEVGDRSTVGPFAHLTPGSTVPADTTTGAFYTATTGD
jgi:bifunctional UDP-N-acetylglucosamine pyrophosphorylase/glucosamine-1-phosphate N-acetyltransferase